MEYNLEFTQVNISCDNFKNKHVNLLKNLINGSRLNNEIKFNSFASISYDDNDVKQKFPIITTIDEYNRNKVNCLIYDITNNDINDVYDKIFIFQHIGKNHSYYGYFLYNTISNQFTHKYCLEYDDAELCINLTKTMNTIKFFKTH